MISFVSGYYGFLGNQMFQAAAVKALSLKLGQPWSFPRNQPDLHQIFQLSAIPKPNPPKMVVLQEPTPTVRYTEPHFWHDPIFWNLYGQNLELSGYFQSEKYFKPYAEQIRQEFRFRWDPVGTMMGMMRENQNISSLTPEIVSIHVRRGDYLSFPEHHPPLTMDYYAEAMSRFSGMRFLVFSDDPGWCLSNFGRENVEISTGRTAAEDMALMAACDHHIIANSSFSWWGAWLGRNPQKRVIAPKNWFGPAKPLPQWDTKDLIPDGWERI